MWRNLLTPFIKIFHELRSRKWTRNLMKILHHGSQDIYGTKGGGRSRYSGERTSDPVTSPLMSSFTPDRASSLPEVLTPIMPDSIVVNISVPSSSVGIETPRNDIVSTTSSNTTDDTHTRIEIVLGRLSLDMNLRTELGLSMGSLQLVISRCDNVWSQVTMYLGRSQKSLRKNWISKDMIGSHLHQRLRTSTGRSLRSDSIGI